MLRSINVKTAQRLAGALDLDGVIIIAFKNGAYKAVSYGDTRSYCAQLKPIIDKIAEEIKA